MLNLSSKPLIAILGFLIVIMQFQIWSANGGISQVWRLKRSITTVETQNKELVEKNTVLAADVEDLKNGKEAIEEHARVDLGMIKKDEIFYQIVE